MILVAIECVLVTATCLFIVPVGILKLAVVMLERQVEPLPVARLLRKRKTERRFQRPVLQRVS